MKLTIEFNCQPLGDDTEAFLTAFESFLICPCRNVGDDDDTEIERCEVGWEEFWSIYGVGPDGLSVAIHDAYDEEAIVRAARQIHLALPDRAWRVELPETGWMGPSANFVEIAEDLTTAIWQDLDEIVDADQRADDFDAHALAGLRESFVEFSDYAGLNTARDPYVSINQAA